MRNTTCHKHCWFPSQRFLLCCWLPDNLCCFLSFLPDKRNPSRMLSARFWWFGRLGTWGKRLNLRWVDRSPPGRGEKWLKWTSHQRPKKKWSPLQKWSDHSHQRKIPIFEIHGKKESTLKNARGNQPTQRNGPTPKIPTKTWKRLAWKTLRATNLGCSSTFRALHARRRKGVPRKPRVRCGVYGHDVPQRVGETWQLYKKNSPVKNGMMKREFHGISCIIHYKYLETRFQPWFKLLEFLLRKKIHGPCAKRCMGTLREWCLFQDVFCSKFHASSTSKIL